MMAKELALKIGFVMVPQMEDMRYEIRDEY